MQNQLQLVILMIAEARFLFLAIVCIVGCNREEVLPEDKSVENATAYQVERVPAERIDHSEAPVESGEPFVPVGADFDFKKLEGVWLSYRVTYGNDRSFLSSVPLFRIDVIRMTSNGEDETPTIRDSPHMLRLYGRFTNEESWRPGGLDAGGWIDTHNDTAHFCFGPWGDHLRLKLRWNGRQLQLHGGEFEDLRLNRVAVDEE
jgi:hypothetical protein